MTEKIKLLCYLDSPFAYTGFATVCKNIIKPLYDSQKYNIHQFAINHDNNFHDTELYPWQCIPARLADPKDPYGRAHFLQLIAKGDYDIIFIVNDTFVLSPLVPRLKEILEHKKNYNLKIPSIIYYYPVDCRLKEEHSELIKMADFPIAYSKFAIEETVKVIPELKDKLQYIYHGTDTEQFFPYRPEIIHRIKKEIFNLKADDYLIINVNRNTSRKQLTRTLLCFKEFRKTVSNSYLYLHANPYDRGINLIECIKELNLELNKDVMIPPNYSSAHGVPEKTLNQIYNAGDLFLSNHLGEGFGLTEREAMAAGTPILVPNNTVEPEIVGKQKGFM